MRTFRKPICTLVVVLTAVIGYLGVSPGNLQAAPPSSPRVNGPWSTYHDSDAQLIQAQYTTGGVKRVTGWFIGPYGKVELEGGWDNSGTLLTLNVTGVRHSGTVNLQITDRNGLFVREMKGKVYLDGLLPIRWTWKRP